MKKRVSIIAMGALTLLSSLASCPVIIQAEEVVPTSNYEVVEQMGLGYNLGKTFSYTVNDNLNVDNIKKRIDAAYLAGFDTIRIPVKWSLHMDEDGNIIADDTIVKLQEVVNYCMKKDLYVILGSMGDLGEDTSSRWDLPDVSTDEFKLEYRNMWTDIADMFNRCDYHLVFEAYNEVKNNNEDVSGYGYNYGSDYTGRADSYYFAGRCNNLINMVNLNAEFSDIMSDVAPDRYYMISSYNADPRSAYSDYTNMTWENKTDHYINGSWNNTWFTVKGVDTSKAIYNCHMYKYGSTFTNEIALLKSTFEKRGIDLPIYVNENGTHTSAIKTGVNASFITPVTYMTQDMASGVCLWDDTQSMSYLNVNDFTWYNNELINQMISAAGQSPRTVEKYVTVTLNTTGSSVYSASVSVPSGTTLNDIVQNYFPAAEIAPYYEHLRDNGDGTMSYHGVVSSNPSSYKGYKYDCDISATWDTAFTEDTVINMHYEEGPCDIACVCVCGGEQGECSKSNAIAHVIVEKGASAQTVIDAVYDVLGGNLPVKDGCVFKGFYQEGTRKYFLYQDSGRTASGYLVLYARFDAE